MPLYVYVFMTIHMYTIIYLYNSILLYRHIIWFYIRAYFYMYAVMVLYTYVYIAFLSLMFNLTFSWNGIIVVFLLFCVQRYGSHS